MNEFIWTDLSTYILKESVEFYKEVLGWQFNNDNNYFIGGYNRSLDVGIYETPGFFKKINMPHFWMNYIQVGNLVETEECARRLGGKVELSNESFYGGRIALIRDPMGAGFTIYEGKNLAQSSKTVGKRELHTSNVEKVINFYEGLFNWNLMKVDRDEFEIHNENKMMGRIIEVDNDVKGVYEYWITEFIVENQETVLSKILEKGGLLISEESNRKLVTDKFKEAFFYITSN